MRRSFWLLVVVGILVEAGASYLAWRAAAAQLPCYWSGFSVLGSGGIAACAHAVPFIGRSAWLPALLIGLIAIVSIGLSLFELARQIMLTRRFQRLLGTMPRGELPSGVARPHRLQVVTSNELLCLCMGYLSPTVIVSSRLLGELEGDEVAATIAHEASHQRRRDPLRQLAAAIAQRGMFFLPFLRDLGDATSVANELEADAVAIRRCGRSALVGALRAMQDQPGPASSMNAMANPATLPERIAALSGERVHMGVRPKRLFVSVLAIVALVALGLSVPTATAAPRPLGVHPVTLANNSPRR